MFIVSYGGKCWRLDQAFGAQYKGTYMYYIQILQSIKSIAELKLLRCSKMSYSYYW